MANTNLFKTGRARNVAPTNTTNLAGGTAYELGDEAALAQIAVTGCFGGTYYASAEDQLTLVKTLLPKVSSEFIARCAVYARLAGFMKDMPAHLVATLAARSKTDVEARELLGTVFPRVIDNPKMLRNFVQIVRSGETGRKSFGTNVKRLIQNYFDSRSPEAIFKGSIGGNPTIADIIKMVHPKAGDGEKSATLKYLIGKNENLARVPKLIFEFESFKDGVKQGRSTVPVPNVPFEMLTALDLKPEHWKEIARNASWTQCRMNINTFKRHGVFDDKELTNLIAEKIANRDEVLKAKAFPFQLMMAYEMTTDAPMPVRLALQDAMEVATENIPEFEGQVFVAVDSSGSMSQAVTGARGSATSKVSCNQAASLFAASVLRKNPTAKIIRFDTAADEVKLNPRDSVMTMARQINRNGGGTDCASAIRYINSQYGKGDLIVMISDNESWFNGNWQYSRGTGTLTEFERFRGRNRNAKLACIDIVPNTTTQAQESENVLNIGGFSDRVFEVVAQFAKTGNTKQSFVDVIKRTSLGATPATE